MISIFTEKTELSSESAKISLLLYRICQGVDKLIRMKGKELELSSTQIQTIIFLSGAHAGNTTVSSVAKRLQIAQPTASRVVDGLVEKNLMARKKSKEDRRKVNLRLTEKGRAITEKLDEISQVLQSVVDQLSDTQQKDLSKMLVVIAGEMQNRGYLSAALVCRYCRYFLKDGGTSEDLPHRCQLTGEDLSQEDSCSEWLHEEKGVNLLG